MKLCSPTLMHTALKIQTIHIYSFSIPAKLYHSLERASISSPPNIYYIEAKTIVLQMHKKHQWWWKNYTRQNYLVYTSGKTAEKKAKRSFQGNIIFLLQTHSEINYVVSASLNILDSERKVQRINHSTLLVVS